MVKVLGVLFLVIGFSGLSFDKIRAENKKIEILKEIRDFAIYLKGEIAYSHIPIPDICNEYLSRGEGQLQIFFKRLCKKFESDDGRSFSEIWEETAETLEVKNTEKNLLKKLGKCFGFSNVEMQMNAIENYLQDLEKILLQYEKKFQDNRKLILYFGVMSGLLLSILLY